MRHSWLIGVVLAVVLAGAGPFAGSAWAKEESGPEIFKPVRPDLLVLTLVLFGALYFFLSRFAWKPVLDGLQKREENIQAALAETQRARDEARKLRDELEARMNQASQAVRDKIDKARQEAQQEKDRLLAAARAEIQAEREKLRHEIDAARDQALKLLRDQTGALATQIASRAVRREVTVNDSGRLVEEALAARGPEKAGW